MPQAMAMIDGARYTIKVKYSDVSSLEEEIKKYYKKMSGTL